ncbi:MAG TPA: hypothetical protein VHG51_08290 [Longimicrobiaceae bacterium]|nr:hypothetical protein [Longimicrobiaceae bacterium]
MRGAWPYLLFGTAVLSLLGLAEYRGWSMLRTNEVRNVPTSVRDNPGAYRPHYYGSGRYVGGK